MAQKHGYKLYHIPLVFYWFFYGKMGWPHFQTRQAVFSLPGQPSASGQPASGARVRGGWLQVGFDAF